MSSSWRELYAEELKMHPRIAALLEDPESVLLAARLSKEEEEVWKLRGGMTEAEVAQVMRRQVKTVRELLRRAEWKLRALAEAEVSVKHSPAFPAKPAPEEKSVFYFRGMRIPGDE